MLSITELSNRTGLTVSFIRKCQKELGDIVNHHIKRGQKNRLLFGDRATALFDEIARLKNEGLAISTIKSSLEKQLSGADKEASITAETSALFERIIEMEKEHAQERVKWEKERSEKEQEVSEKKHALEVLKKELKFLPEGKTIQDLSQDVLTKQEELVEQERRRSERQRILSELKNLGFFSFRRKQELLDELEKLN